jgi:hypothetical protein
MSEEVPAWATWDRVLQLGLLPAEFVQWAAQREGGLPDGPIQEADYLRLKKEYEDATGA